MSGLLTLDVFTVWLAVGERGISSEAIVSQLTGVPVGGARWSGDHPADPSDFRRCQLLLERVPLARIALPAMANRSPEWSRLVAHWDEIHDLIESESPNYLSDPRGSAPAAYQLMRQLIAGEAA